MAINVQAKRKTILSNEEILSAKRDLLDKCYNRLDSLTSKAPQGEIQIEFVSNGDLYTGSSLQINDVDNDVLGKLTNLIHSLESDIRSIEKQIGIEDTIKRLEKTA